MHKKEIDRESEMYIVFGSTNRGKVQEVKGFLQQQHTNTPSSSVQIMSLLEFHQLHPGVGLPPEVEEDLPTYEGNVRKKAEKYAEWSHVPVIADDTGIEVECLGGAPGIYSARYAGEPSDAGKNVQKLLAVLKNSQARNAKFVCVIACKIPGKECAIFRGELAGTITQAPQGGGGFGYDCIFIPEGFAETLATLKERKEEVETHRIRALRMLVSHLTAMPSVL